MMVEFYVIYTCKTKSDIDHINFAHIKPVKQILTPNLEH